MFNNESQRVKPESAVSVLLLLAGCSALAPAEKAFHRFEDAHFPASTALAFDPQASVLASGGLAGDLALWRVSPPKKVMRFAAHKGAVRALHFADRDTLLSAGEDGKLLLWQAPWKAPIAAAQSSSVTSMSADSERVVTGHEDGWIRVWALPSLALIHNRRLAGAVRSLALDRERIAVGTDAGRVALLGLELELLRELEKSPWSPRDLRFSPDGKWLAAGMWFRIQVWEVASGRRQSVATEHHGLVISLDFSPDGQLLASLGHHTDSAIRLIEAGTWKVTRRLEAHRLCGEMVRFSPDGRYLASASDDESVRLYEIRGERAEDGARIMEDRGLTGAQRTTGGEQMP